LRSRELSTTETELKAIANPAKAGLRISPKLLNRPAAIGIPEKL